jgi:uncharacterized Zn finger protein
MICPHEYKYDVTHNGFMDFKGPIVLGVFDIYRCKNCGKVRITKIKNSKHKIVVKRKDRNQHYQIDLL